MYLCWCAFSKWCVSKSNNIDFCLKRRSSVAKALLSCMDSSGSSARTRLLQRIGGLVGCQGFVYLIKSGPWFLCRQSVFFSNNINGPSTSWILAFDELFYHHELIVDPASSTGFSQSSTWRVSYSMFSQTLRFCESLPRVSIYISPIMFQLLYVTAMSGEILCIDWVYLHAPPVDNEESWGSFTTNWTNQVDCWIS